MMRLRDRLTAGRPTRAVLALALAAFSTPPLGAADPAPFDLPGPDLRIKVTRGSKTLPIGEVPGLATGDTLTIAADLPDDQRARYLLLSAFLQGATNPPPKRWIKTAETWKRKDKDKLLTLTVPDGARQLALFLVPETGGASGTIADNVRGRPGEFVRATQDLNQASLDRSRLNAFMGAIRTQDSTHPEFLKTVAPTLARSLSMKLNQDCLARVIDLQAACLLENRDSLVLVDVHSSSIAETLAGTPTDLALQLSSTREAGLGYYSPYIGVIRDVVRIFGAFNNPQFDYLPTLSLRHGDGVSLLLNAAPSFAKPKSVLVVAMPSIEADSPPRLRNATDQPICIARPGAVLPVDGAPLIYSTAYARNMAVRLTSATGQTVDLPVEARADRGGYVLKGDIPEAARFRGSVKARLHGDWGFEPFQGPEFVLQMPSEEGWATGEGAPTLVAGRTNQLTLAAPAPACVESIALKGSGTAPVTWKPRGDTGLDLALPLDAIRPGDVSVEIRQYGAKPVTVALRAYEQASRFDRLALHAGDRWGELWGQRLDQVATVELGGMRLKPDGLSREGDVDRLRVAAEGAGTDIAPGPGNARVVLKDGRATSLAVTVAPARPRVTLLNKTVSEKQAAGGGVPLTVLGQDMLSDRAQLAFSVRAAPGTRLLPSDAIEIAMVNLDASVRLSNGPNLRLEGPDVMVARFDPATLGPSAFGPLQFRIVRGGETSDWQPLATLARLPRIDGVDCAGGGTPGCTLRGDGLYLIAAVSPTRALDQAVPVPQGYTGATLAAPAAVDGSLYLRLRDAPDDVVTLPVPRPAA
jgi:hypothetical protein